MNKKAKPKNKIFITIFTIYVINCLLAVFYIILFINHIVNILSLGESWVTGWAFFYMVPVGFVLIPAIVVIFLILVLNIVAFNGNTKKLITTASILDLLIIRIHMWLISQEWFTVFLALFLP